MVSIRRRWSSTVKRSTPAPNAGTVSRPAAYSTNGYFDKQALLFKMYWKVYPIYVVPKDRKKRIEEIRTRKTIYEFIDSTDPDNLYKLHEVIRDIEMHERNEKCLWIEFLDNF